MGKSGRGAFAAYVVDDLLSGVSGASVRPMFGGFGLYADGLMFGIIVDDTLYFKTDDTNRARYAGAGSEPFRYAVKNRPKPVTLSFWEVPAEVADDRDSASEWAADALAAARRAARARAKRPKR